MKFTFCTLSWVVFFLFFIACNRPDPALDAAHHQSVELTEAMRQSHKGMQEKLDFMQKENRELSAKAKDASQPDSALLATVLQTDAVILHFESLLKQQKELIEQNEDFIKKHERSSVPAAEMQAQHEQIRQNYEKVQTEAASLLVQLESMKTMHETVEPAE